jgi:hypothetical protein
MSPIKRKGRDRRPRPSVLICAYLCPPATAATQPTEKEFGVSGLSKTQPDGARKTAPKSTCLQRASSKTLRLLGTRNPSILITDEGKARRLLKRGLVPPVLRVDGGREAEVLASSLALVVLATGWPLIASFEGGPGLLTRYAGIDLVDGFCDEARRARG